MTWQTERWSAADHPHAVAGYLVETFPESGRVVLTGGTTAERVYPLLADATAGRWRDLEVFFSDERCVPPDHAASNFGMARRLLLEPVGAERVHRMVGEIDPEIAAERYHSAVSSAVLPATSAPEEGFELVLLGMGADCHIAGLYPGSPAIGVSSRLCTAVDRPDGMTGLTLTPPALLAARRVVLIVGSQAKAEAVRRVVAGSEMAHECPARLLAPLADEGKVTFLLDDAAAALV